jgi:hypothetical protein
VAASVDNGRTAVRLAGREGDVALAYGSPLELRDRIAVFGPDQIVAYSPGSGSLAQLLVFRTLPSTARAGADKLPGVYPRARLLVEVRGACRVNLLRRTFSYLARAGIHPERLSLGFWVRLDALLSGRVPPKGGVQLEALLRHETLA